MTLRSLLFVTVLIAAAAVSVRVTAHAQSAHHASDRPGESFVIVSGDSTTMNGSSDDVERARELQTRISGDYVWFVRNSKAYFIDDPAWVKQAQDLFKPQEELGQRQSELGEEQSKLGELQSKVSVKMPAIDQELPGLQAESKRLQAQNSEVTQEQLSDLQARMGELQGKLGEAQAAAGEKQAELGEHQAKLGEKQALLGEQQAKLGEEAARQINSMLDTALRSGKARLAQ